MKKIFFIFSIAILLLVAYVAIMNVEASFGVNYLKAANGEYSTELVNGAFYTLLILCSGIFVGSGILSLFLGIQNDKVNAYKRELERTSISGEANSSRVEVLEAKIKTLEKAFNTVVDERTKLEIQIQDLNSEIDKLNKN
ncbi:hypothetical protein IJ579_07760 [bacterium]|nr:hypothetical protein [bacterium]